MFDLQSIQCVAAATGTMHSIVHIALLTPQLKKRLWPSSDGVLTSISIRLRSASDLGTFPWMENCNEEVVAGHCWLGSIGNGGYRLGCGYGSQGTAAGPTS